MYRKRGMILILVGVLLGLSTAPPVSVGEERPPPPYNVEASLALDFLVWEASWTFAIPAETIGEGVFELSNPLGETLCSDVGEGSVCDCAVNWEEGRGWCRFPSAIPFLYPYSPDECFYVLWFVYHEDGYSDVLTVALSTCAVRFLPVISKQGG